MSAVLLALFKDYETADRVRTELVQDGFPTDRIDLTALGNLGRAGMEPAESLHGKLAQYFGTLFSFDSERPFAERFADRVEDGAAAITVHPRGAVETARATEIPRTCGAAELEQHDLVHRRFEQAAASHEGAWIRSFWIESTGDAHCIYCRMFPGSTH